MPYKRLLKLFSSCVYLSIRPSVSVYYIKIIENWKKFFLTKMVLKHFRDVFDILRTVHRAVFL